MSKMFFKVIFYLMVLAAASTLQADNNFNDTCPYGAENVSLGNVSGSVTDGADTWDYYYIQPGAGTLTLSNYESSRNTDVYFSKNNCASNRILNGGTSISSESLTLTPSDVVYIAIREQTNRGRTITYSFTLAFTPAGNTAPVANDQSVSVTENTSQSITLTASDADGDSLTYHIDSQPANGMLSGTAPNVIYTPNSGFTGTDTFTFYVNDGEEDSNVATVTITVSEYTQPTSFVCANPKTFSMIYQINAFGDIALIGNSNLCADNNHDGQCENPGDATNNNINMINNDYDDDSSTFNSTGAELSLPAGAEILYAGLLWQGYFSGSLSDSRKAEGKSIKFKYEGQNYISLTADEMNWVYFTSTRMYYQSYKDVTDYVKAYGAGYYWTADVATTLGQPNGGSFGAWSLAVAYKDENGKFKNLTFYHGYQAMANDSDIASAISYARDHGCSTSNTGVSNDTGAWLTGFITPKAGTVDAKLTVFTGEGDIGLTGDTVSVTDVGGTAHNLWNGVNPITNVMNATISFDGSIVTTGKPFWSYNSLGIDIDTYNISNYISNQQSSTYVDFHTVGDGYMPGFFAFSADLHVPNICYDYSYEQLNRYFTEENNGTKEPRITGNIVPNQPITVGIYFRNNEESDIKATDNLLSVYNIGTTSDLTLISGSTEVTYAGANNPVAVTPASQGAHFFTYLDLGDIDGQQYVYAYYQIDPHDNIYIDIPLNADINYTLNLLDLSGNVIPLSYQAQLGSGKVPLCRGAGGGTGYEPIYNSFNVENPNLYNAKMYNLYTQVSGRPWDASIVSYAPTNDYNDRNDSAEWVKVELIDAGAYHDPTASCTERDSNITRPVAFYFTSTRDEYGAPTNNISFNSILDAQGIDKVSYYNVAVEEAAYRVWHLVNPFTGEMLKAVCSEQTPMWTFFNEYHDFVNDAGCISVCNSASSACNKPNGNNSDKYLEKCLECLYPYMAVPVCSRDNFAIRPESFVTRLIDDNTSTIRSVALSKNPAYDGETINLAGGYPYRYDVNATSHATDVFGDQGVRGYINNFGSFNLSTNRAYMSWTPSEGQTTTGCNAPVDQNMSFVLQDGTTYNSSVPWMTPTRQRLTNVGEYTYRVEDSRWTHVDFDPDFLTHHTGSHFYSGADCDEGSSAVPGTSNTTSKVGCQISSIHNNVDTGDTYVAFNIRAYPYAINVSDVNDTDTDKIFYYMNNVAVNGFTNLLTVDENHSVHLFGSLVARGKDGSQMSNFVQNCYAEPVVFTYNASVTSAGGFPLRWRETNSTTDSTDITQLVNIVPTNGSNAFIRENNGSTTLDLHINFDRSRTTPVNPVDLNISTIAADCNISASTPYCTTNANGVDNHQAFSTATLLSRHWMLYGRVHAPRYRVECSGTGNCSTTTAPNQALILYDEFYYDLNSTIDANSSLTTVKNISSGVNRSVDSINWYTNIQHGSRDGNATQVVQYYMPGASPISVISGPTIPVSGRSTLNVTYDGTDGYPYKATMGITASPWLIYNRFDAAAIHNDFELEFNAAQLGEDSNLSDSNLTSPNTSRRIRW